MNPIYLRLFDGYAADILQKADPFDSKSVDQLAASTSREKIRHTSGSSATTLSL